MSRLVTEVDEANFRLLHTIAIRLNFVVVSKEIVQILLSTYIDMNTALASRYDTERRAWGYLC